MPSVSQTYGNISMTVQDLLQPCRRLIGRGQGNIDIGEGTQLEKYSFLQDVGQCASDTIFWMASWLVEPEVPGWISIVIALAFLATVFFAWRRLLRSMPALKWLERRLLQMEGEHGFKEHELEMTSQFREMRGRRGFEPIVVAWCKFRETLVLNDKDKIMRNSVRPAAFFNLEDLGGGPGFYRHMPGIFVSVGLLLTFLGLISALQSAGGGFAINASEEDRISSMKDLLGAASAKFIMSLTGLAASIFFTLFLRLLLGRVERKIHKVCSLLEDRLKFISLEEIAEEQLQVARGQEAAFQKIGTELVEKFGRQLREEMSHVMDKMGAAGAKGVEKMADDLAIRLSQEIGEALTSAGKKISDAAEKMEGLINSMNQSAGKMTQDMEGVMVNLAETARGVNTSFSSAAEATGQAFNKGAEKFLEAMTKHLDDIRNNTSESAQALKEAAEGLRNSAEIFKEKMGEAAESGARQVREGMIKAGEEAGSAVAEASGVALDALRNKMREEVLEKIGELVGQFSQISERLRDGSDKIKDAADNIKRGGDISREGSEALSQASRDLQTASAPIQESIERLDGSVNIMSDSTERAAGVVMQSAREVAENAARVLEAARDALGGQQTLLQESIASMGTVLHDMVTMLERMNEQQIRMDDMDEKLGNAFNEFKEQVNVAIVKLIDHVRTMNDELGPAIDKLHDVVDRAETFLRETEDS